MKSLKLKEGKVAVKAFFESAGGVDTGRCAY